MLRKCDDYAMWSSEVSGAYMAYSSITEERTSVRAHYIAKDEEVFLYGMYNNSSR